MGEVSTEEGSAKATSPSDAFTLDTDGDIKGEAARRLFGATVICSGILERIGKPEGLLNLLRQMLDLGAELILLTTASRKASQDEKTAGPPSNPHHLREWSQEELDVFLRCSVLPVAWLSEIGSTLYAVLTQWQIPSPL